MKPRQECFNIMSKYIGIVIPKRKDSSTICYVDLLGTPLNILQPRGTWIEVVLPRDGSTLTRQTVA